MPGEPEPRTRVVRRLMHIGMSLSLVYYLVPYYIWGFPRVIWMLAVLLIVPITFDAVRLSKRKLYFGLREHERERIASYVWFFIGSAFLMAFFPQEVAAPIILAVAVGDVVLGEVRRFRRRYAYGITYLTCTGFFVLFGYPVGSWAAPAPSIFTILLTLFAGLITTLAESIELEIHWGVRDDFFTSRSKGTVSKYQHYFELLFKFDDDFLMQIIPGLILGLIWLGKPELFPPALITPLPDPWNVWGAQKWFFEAVTRCAI